METVRLLEQALSGLLGCPPVADLIYAMLDRARVLVGFLGQPGNRVAEPIALIPSFFVCPWDDLRNRVLRMLMWLLSS